MTKEYIMQVQIDDDGHEYDMTRKEEIVRCRDCVFSDSTMATKDGKVFKVFVCEEWNDYALLVPDNGYCYKGERKQ